MTNALFGHFWLLEFEISLYLACPPKPIGVGGYLGYYLSLVRFLKHHPKHWFILILILILDLDHLSLQG